MTMTPEQRAWRRQGKARCIAKARALLAGGRRICPLCKGAGVAGPEYESPGSTRPCRCCGGRGHRPDGSGYQPRYPVSVDWRTLTPPTGGSSIQPPRTCPTCGRAI